MIKLIKCNLWESTLGNTFKGKLFTSPQHMRLHSTRAIIKLTINNTWTLLLTLLAHISPHALQRVFGPSGPRRIIGVDFSLMPQCWQLKRFKRKHQAHSCNDDKIRGVQMAWNGWHIKHINNIFFNILPKVMCNLLI